MTTRKITWLAGILEGEGTFMVPRRRPHTSRTPSITVQMNDKDVIERVAALWARPVYGPYFYTRNNGVYRTTINGRAAIGWMLTLYTEMGVRRRAKIAEVMAAWTFKPKELFVG